MKIEINADIVELMEMKRLVEAYAGKEFVPELPPGSNLVVVDNASTTESSYFDHLKKVTNGKD